MKLLNMLIIRLVFKRKKISKIKRVNIFFQINSLNHKIINLLNKNQGSILNKTVNR